MRAANHPLRPPPRKRKRRRSFLLSVLGYGFGAAVVLFIAMDVMGMVGPGDGIAHAAHLGGAAFGGALWATRNPRAWQR